MDWFERLTGFRETSYGATQAQMVVEGETLVSRANGQRYRAGRLELLSLRALRERAAGTGVPAGRMKVRNLVGNVRALHQVPEFAGGLFQVASQFNLLEMMSPGITPEHGVTLYQHDGTQGPACAMAAGAATIYRNYFVPLDGGMGQTSQRQINALAGLGQALSQALARPVHKLWTLQNGYAMGTAEGLAAIGQHLAGCDERQLDELRGHLCIGLHWDVEVTDAEGPARPVVSQAFCSAVPVSYSGIEATAWQPFARLVLDAAYEASLLAACVNATRGASNVVLLTRLGGGAFGNDPAWIDAAMERSLARMAGAGLDVRLVSHRQPPASMLAFERRWG